MIRYDLIWYDIIIDTGTSPIKANFPPGSPPGWSSGIRCCSRGFPRPRSSSRRHCRGMWRPRSRRPHVEWRTEGVGPGAWGLGPWVLGWGGVGDGGWGMGIGGMNLDDFGALSDMSLIFWQLLAINLPTFGRQNFGLDRYVWHVGSVFDCEEGPSDGHDWKKAENPTKDEDSGFHPWGINYQNYHHLKSARSREWLRVWVIAGYYSDASNHKIRCMYSV